MSEIDTSDYKVNHKRLFHFGMQCKKVWVGLGLLSVATAGAIVTMMYALSTAVDYVFMQQKPLTAIMPILILLGGVMVFRGMLFWLSEVLAQRAASELKQKLRIRLFDHIQKLGPAWADSQKSGELASTAVEGVDKLDDYYARFMPAGIHMAIVPVILGLFVLWIDWLSGLILIITGPLIPVFMSLIGMKAQSRTQEQWSTLSRLSGHFLDTVQGLRTLKLFNQTENKSREIEDISDRFRLTTMGVLRIAFLSGMVLELFASIATALVAVEIGIRLVEGHIAFQLGFFVLLLAPEFYLPFRMFGAQHHAGMEGTEAANRIFEILDTPVPLIRKEKEPAISVPEQPYQIQFQNVEFSYPQSVKKVIRNATFTIAAGKNSAMVGRTGSGKTTISRLLSRQITPDSGQIIVNGVALDLIDEEQWLDQLAIVNQHVRLFDDTIFNNIKVARPDAPFEEVIQAAKYAEADEFITRLPEGYQTRTTEGAARLSGGERQRISIARAFLKDAPVVILDEPSSSLDPESERHISKALDQLLVHRTVLIIAHRLSTVRNADQILVLDDGKIAESGTHSELKAGGNLYANMLHGKTESD